jgi:uroporphyrin-III C-methyltransferase / precorrin-2 dehydrogenase / sirohydrochlorin ferrochelatase
MVGTDNAPYLLALRLTGRRVTIIGGGTVAARRIPGLLDSGADVAVISPELSPQLAELAAAGRVRWIQRGYAAGDCAGAWLVGACASDPDVNSAVADEADAAGIWCVRADDAAASRAWTPASGTAGDVRVGVLSGDPRHSARVRDAIVGELASGAIASRPGEVPGDKPQRPGAPLPGDKPQRPGAPLPGDKPQRPGAPLPGATSRGGTLPAGLGRGSVALVGGGPGDPGLITVRGRQLLGEADVVITDRLAPRSLLAELAPDVEIVDAAKVPRGAAVAQEHINALLVEHARAGRFVVRLKGGDPFIFGRGSEEVLACLRAGIAVTVVPGVSSAAAVPAAAGVPLTHRGIAREFHVVSAHVAPGDERSAVDWRALAASPATLVLLMATEHLQAVADTLIRHGRHPRTPVSAIANGTLPSQRTINARLDTVARDCARAGLRPPAVVVVGEVVTISEQISELCGGLAGMRPWGTFVPREGQHSGEQVIPAARGSGPGEEGGSDGSPPTSGAVRHD